MKIHLVRTQYKTGEKVTHFTTVCGKLRHVFTNLPYTTDKLKVTCKVCCKK